jgi:hypothetical protein
VVADGHRPWREVGAERADGNRRHNLGAVKVYASTTGAYDERAESLLHRFSQQAAIFVANVHTARSARRIGDDLKNALRGRDDITTATGMTMAREGLNFESGYRLLMWLAGSAHLPLKDLAAQLVATPNLPADR